MQTFLVLLETYSISTLFVSIHAAHMGDSGAWAPTKKVEHPGERPAVNDWMNEKINTSASMCVCELSSIQQLYTWAM